MTYNVSAKRLTENRSAKVALSNYDLQTYSRNSENWGKTPRRVRGLSPNRARRQFKYHSDSQSNSAILGNTQCRTES
jgi:hypothetical protein